jgi:hypothetical protein
MTVPKGRFPQRQDESCARNETLARPQLALVPHRTAAALDNVRSEALREGIRSRSLNPNDGSNCASRFSSARCLSASARDFVLARDLQRGVPIPRNGTIGLQLQFASFSLQQHSEFYQVYSVSRH